MRRSVAALLTMLIVQGCFPMSLYYKEGISVDRMTRDETACEVSALRAAPVATRIRRTPPRYIPPYQVCSKTGACTIYPGYWIGGSIYTVDVNEPLRERVMLQCMADKGYRPEKLKPCPASVVRNTPPAATTVLPRLTPGSCVIRNKSGSWQIVTP